jgi:hypothetical protein
MLTTHSLSSHDALLVVSLVSSFLRTMKCPLSHLFFLSEANDLSLCSRSLRLVGLRAVKQPLFEVSEHTLFLLQLFFEFAFARIQTTKCVDTLLIFPRHVDGRWLRHGVGWLGCWFCPVGIFGGTKE